MPEETFREWAILELLGHRRLAGLVTEQEIAGKGFLRIEIPGPNDSFTTQFYSPASVYALTPTSEEVARRVAGNSVHEPVRPYELRLPPGATEADIDVEPSGPYDPEAKDVPY